MKYKLAISALLLIISMLSVSCRQSDDVNRTMDKIIDPYRFSIAQWEINTLTGELEDALFERSSYTIDDSQAVVDFFKLVEELSGLEFQISYYKDQIDEEEMTILENRLADLKQQRDLLKNGIEDILSLQIRETLKQLDLYLYNDITGIDIPFPPINFSLESPPNLLIVSPRDSIYRMKEVILLQDLTQDEIDYIETEIDKLGYSSIVLRVGGMATFPSFVTNNAGLEFTISTAVEEWFHQYFFFQPSGFLYASNLLGLYSDNDISTINETIAGIVSDEIASMIYQNYYAAYYETDVSVYEEDTSADPEDSAFDFYKEMRNIRIAVDNYLAAGEVGQAEAFMEEKRLYILSQGYYIRRLNQAYFAFYGTYASSPSTVNPSEICCGFEK